MILRGGGEIDRRRGPMSGPTERAEQALRDKTQQLEAITQAMTVFLDRGDWGDASGCLLRAALDLTDSEYGFVGVAVDDTFRVLAHGGVIWDATTNRAFCGEIESLLAFALTCITDPLTTHFLVCGVSAICAGSSSVPPITGSSPSIT